MRVEDEERVLAAVKMTMQFYGKGFDDLTAKFWRRWMRQESNSELILEALRQYPNKGKFAPKPADIQQIMEEIRPPRSTHKQAEIVDDCPALVRQAWSYWIPRFWDKDLPFNTDVDESKAEEYLVLVNEEAKRTKMPEAIPDTHKLAQVWT